MLPQHIYSTLMEAFLMLQQWSDSPISYLFLLFCPLLLLLSLRGFRSPQVYLVDFSCFKPPSFCRVPFSSFLEHVSMIPDFDKESVEFMAKTLASSGLGQETYFPPALHYIPPKSHQHESIAEAEMVLFDVFKNLLDKTRLSPDQIDILIVNCTGFCPAPSLASMLVNRFALRTDVKSFNLSGMGCSASIVAVDMARTLLKTHRNSNAVVLSTEILSTGWYPGHERSRLLLNCVFRMGSAAVLLTNRTAARKSSKYKLRLTVRTNRMFDDMCYGAAMREEDSKGKLGVSLKRHILQVARDILHAHISDVCSQILPLSEKIRIGVSILQKTFLGKSGKEEIEVPNVKRAVDHFCFPTSGKPLIREISKNLKLEERDAEAALMTVHRFGNQSSASLWYELAYLEAKDRVTKGDVVWMLGMGSGPKCNSLVLDSLRPILGKAQSNPWADCVDRCAVHLRVLELKGPEKAREELNTYAPAKLQGLDIQRNKRAMGWP